MRLFLHSGSARVGVEEVHELAAPEATRTWHPIPHGALLRSVRRSITASGLRVVAEDHAIGREGNRYFGLLQVQNGSSPADYSTVIGLRNSHDKCFPAGLVVGSRVFVCDNLAFSGEVQISWRHTRHIMRDLPSLIERAVGKLGDLRIAQDERIEAYKNTTMTDFQAYDLLVRSIDARVLPVTKLPKVLAEWRSPRHPEFAEQKNTWRLFNGFTEVMKGTNVFNMPRTSQALHGLMDAHCGLVAN